MRNYLVIMLVLSLGMALYSCKTNEKNMNDAYIKAMAGRESADAALDSTIYNKVRQEMQHGTMTVNGNTVDVSTQWVRVTDGGGGINESLKRFNVVVGQFKQIFNAKSMRERLADSGYPGAFVVETREPYYFVVAASFADANEAIAFLHKVEKDSQLKIKAPLPFILEPAQHRR